jgi:hypothetical protein
VISSIAVSVDYLFQNVTRHRHHRSIILMFGTRVERIAPESLLSDSQRFVHGQMSALAQ